MGIILAFGLIFGMVIRRVNLGLALITGSLVIGVTFGFSAGGLVHIFSSALRDPLTLELSLIVAFVGILAFCMRETGLTTELIGNLKGTLSSRDLLAFVPALFGLMPIAGGALISAPYVEETSSGLRIKPEMKSSINMWFRHAWMPILPLEPALILAAMLAGVGLYDLILIQIPVFILYTFVGYLAFIRPLPIKHLRKKKCKVQRIFLAISPILMIILLNVLGIPLPIALAIGIGGVFALRRTSPKKSLSLLGWGIPWGLIFAVVGVMIFRHTILSSNAFNLVFSSLMDAGVPLLLFLTVLPFLFGFILGSPTAAVGIYFPLIFSVIGVDIVTVSALYLGIFFGYLISPIHFCLVLTISYFKSWLPKVYGRLIPLTILIYSIGLVILFFQL